jgi:calcium-dependent protein kinase
MKKDVAMLESEISILKELDHPNIVRFYETYIDYKYIHIVMQLCTGGELFDRIVKLEKFSEKDAAELMSKILSAVQHLHEHNICHRDLKPENFLFKNNKENAEIKIIDFGLSKKFSKLETDMTTIVGTPFYVAPEVLSGNYDTQCDLWSWGVILYVLLWGYPPFDGDSNKDIFRAILKSKLDFDEDEWGNISGEAKELISKLLEKDPKKRIKVDNALTHKWFKKWQDQTEEVKEFQTEYLTRLKNYRAPNRLQYEVLSFLMKNLDTSERVKIKQVFRNITAKSSGDLTFVDLEDAFKDSGMDGATDHIEELKKWLDFDKDGKIKYTDFLLATINKNEALTDANIKFAFHHFDTDNNGYITLDNLVEAFHREGKGLDVDEIKDILAQADISNTGKISLDDFTKIMKYDQHKHGVMEY